MSSRIKGILFGVLTSFAGIALWVFFGAVLEIISGWAGALMGIGFLLVYKKFNPNDKSPLSIIFAFVLVAIEVIISELITLAIIASTYDLPLSLLFADADMQGAIVSDILIGYLFTFGGLLIYLLTERQNNKRKAALAAQLALQKEAADREEAERAKAAELAKQNQETINPFETAATLAEDPKTDNPKIIEKI